MLETCLENKIIYDFLILYDKSRWHKLIPSLIEIAILNLKSSFNTLIFSEEDIYNIIKDLLKLEEPFNYSMSPQVRKANKERDIFYKPSTEWRPSCGLSDYEICDNSKYCFSSKNFNKRKLKNVKSKIKEMVDNDKRNYYLNNSENNLSSYNKKQRINYAISYDKNLEPELIERTTIRKNKKEGKNGGKKIIQKMTQEEYEHKFREESQNNNDIYCDENGGKKMYIQRRNQTEVIDPEESERLYNNYIYSNNKINKRSPKKNNNKNKKNLYHYNTVNNYRNNNINDIFMNNARQSYQKNNINPINHHINGKREAIPKPQKGIENIEKQNEDRNRKLNNNNIKINTNINIENLSNDKDEKESDYDNNIYQFTGNNYGLINESDKNSFIGIDKKYEKKIDELERNILNNETKFTNSSDNNNENNTKEDDNKNNIENYSNKIKVDITNMEEYEMKKDKNKNKNDNNANNDNINYNYNEENQEQEYNDMNEEDNNEENNEDNIEDNNGEINVDENEDYEENENEENEEEENINNDEENESSEGENNEDGFLSQMSNMTEKTKLLFKKAMDEYPPLEEDTFYGQIQSKNN